LFPPKQYNSAETPRNTIYTLYGSVSVHKAVNTIAREPRRKFRTNNPTPTQRVIDIYAINIGALLEGTKQKI